MVMAEEMDLACFGRVGLTHAWQRQVLGATYITIIDWIAFFMYYVNLTSMSRAKNIDISNCDFKISNLRQEHLYIFLFGNTV